MKQRTPGPAVPLAYQTAAPAVRLRLPGWATKLAIVYGIVLAFCAASPVWLSAIQRQPVFAAAAVFGTALLAAELSLLVAPLRLGRRWPIGRRLLLIPAIGSGVMIAALVLGCALAMHELLGEGERFVLATYIVTPLAAAAWVALCMLASFRVAPERIARSLHRWLCGAAILQLLTAVTADIVVRFSGGGAETSLGVFIGLAMLLVAIGPGIAFLCFRHAREVAPPEFTSSGSAGSNPA